jgi:ligand-binding sensor domain-containing protein
MLQKNTTYFFITIVAYIFLPCYTNAQQYSYTQYTTSNGLAGNKIYQIAQDINGYIWFATDNGLSRFDGRNFKNYTTKDGLPDNEVLQIFPDSYGRLWISTFNKKIAFYKNGIIFTDINSVLLQSFQLPENTIEIFESPERKLYLLAARKIYEVDNNKAKLFYADSYSYRLDIDYSNYIKKPLLFVNDTIFYYHQGKFVFFKKENNKPNTKNLILRYTDLHTPIIIPKPHDIISLNFKYTYGEFNHIAYINTHNGSQKIDTATGKMLETYLPNQRVSYTFEDKEQNLWFATLGNGVFKLKTTHIKFYPFTSSQNNSEVFSVQKINNQIAAGLSFGKVSTINTQSLQAANLNFPDNATLSQNAIRLNRVTCMIALNQNTCFFGMDSYLSKLQNGKQQFIYLKPIKSLSVINQSTILVGTSNYAVTISTKDLSIIDTVYHQRSTKVKFAFGNYFIGTQNGLFINNKKLDSITGRVTDIALTNDSIVWVSTNNNGLYGIKNNKIIQQFNEKNGLISNNIKSLFATNNIVWIGTFNGLNKLDRKNNKVTTYTTDDGLPSDIINAIYVEDTIVWLGTNIGLVRFDETKITKPTFCNITLVSINSSNKQLDADTITLPYHQNNIKFQHNAISFKSEKGILFKYKMEGLDTNWQETTSNEVNFPSLPYGDFTFKIYALNKFGVQSRTLSYKIFVTKPFWEKAWFIMVMSLTFIGLVALVAYKYVQRNKKRDEEKRKFLEEIHYAKQMALQTQMNPHFIFNCLNNIQKFIFKNDIENTNKYLTNFATLIRNTLANADKLSISLEDEISYLTKYLDMEKLRFENKLNYEFTIAKEIDIKEIEVPTMLFQPFIENSIKHGILNKRQGVGLIQIILSESNNFLQCKIIDNGIGRKEAAKIKSAESVLFESKGVDITNRRIEMLNYNKTEKVSLYINDLVDDFNNPLGTEVTILIPLNFL